MILRFIHGSYCAMEVLDLAGDPYPARQDMIDFYAI
jgi:hypothetical protein